MFGRLRSSEPRLDKFLTIQLVVLEYHLRSISKRHQSFELFSAVAVEIIVIKEQEAEHTGPASLVVPDSPS